MNAKRKRSVRTSPNKGEAPEITEAWVAEADVRRGSKLLRRGRPRLENPKQLLSLRLAPGLSCRLEGIRSRLADPHGRCAQEIGAEVA